MIVTRAGTRIDNGMWEQNNDDGWYHVTLPFDFNWFGTTERIITIGTNGVLSFGTFDNEEMYPWELPLFLVLGTFCGLLGALFNHNASINNR